MRVHDGCSGSGIGGGVGNNCGRFLLLLALHAEAAFSGQMHAPHNVMHAPMVRMLAHFFGFLVAVLGRDFFPHLILLLPVLVTPVLLVARLLVVV